MHQLHLGPPNGGFFLFDSNLPGELISAYRQTEYRAFTAGGMIVLRIGQPCEDIVHLYNSGDMNGAAFITAENPLGQQQSVSENAAAQNRLLSKLIAMGARIFEGEGRGADPGWPAEASFLAIGIARDQACLLGKKYLQNAIVWIGDNSIPELVLLR